MSISSKYQWLQTIGTLPKMIQNGLRLLGVKEIPGAKSNPIIMDMANAIDVSDIYKNDDTSWCALFQSYICKISGKPPINPKGDKYNFLRAKSFADWGNPVVRGDEKLGDILVFKRPGGFHVGMYIAESPVTFYVLGGNQSNAVTITEIAKARLVACRRFYATAAPASAQKYKLSASGQVSTNEA